MEQKIARIIGYTLLAMTLAAVSCSSPQRNGNEQETTSQVSELCDSALEILNSDTLWVSSELLDQEISFDFGQNIFKKLKDSKIKATTKPIPNPHSSISNELITYQWGESEYTFLKVNANNNAKSKIFFIRGKDDWGDTKLNTITQIAPKIKIILSDIDHRNANYNMVTITNLDGGAQLYLKMLDKEIVSFEYISWMD